MRPVVINKAININDLKEILHGQTIVSIQPVECSPLAKTEIIVAMAQAAEQAGAKALRIQSVNNVKAL